MPIQMIRNDITKMNCDAIVNAANQSLLGGGGVDGAIHRAAGKELLAECVKLGGCKTGQAKITGAYHLPCRYVIHTVGPVWRGGMHGEQELLKSCYQESLKLAKAYDCESVAFPLISSGVYGYPKAQALQVALDTIQKFLEENDMLVYIVIFDKTAYQIGEQLFSEIQSYIDENYVESHQDAVYERMRRLQMEEYFPKAKETAMEDPPIVESAQSIRPPKKLMKKSPLRSRIPKARFVSEEDVSDYVLGAEQSAGRILEEPALYDAKKSKKSELWDGDFFDETKSLEELLSQVDESFSQMLLRMIDEKGLTDVQCYKKANVDRKLFSKIRGDVQYRPKKSTVLAFAIALELTLEETKDMLMKAGFALSHSSKFDIIIEYFIKHQNYNIMKINEMLFAFDQSLLGG